MQTSKFIEILKDKIAEAYDNINEIAEFHLISTRTFGYTAYYYDEVQVENALSKLKKWQQVIQDILKMQYQSDKHENYIRFAKTIEQVKNGFDYKKELPKEYSNGITVLNGILESINLLSGKIYMWMMKKYYMMFLRISSSFMDMMRQDELQWRLL